MFMRLSSGAPIVVLTDTYTVLHTLHNVNNKSHNTTPKECPYHYLVHLVLQLHHLHLHQGFVAAHEQSELRHGVVLL